VITIPTGDLTGILADVIPFACPEDELPLLNCVRLEWDGKQLHAMSTDQFRMAISTWDPYDLPAHDSQDDLFTHWGSDDEPWSAILPLNDAKEIVKVFKLGPKETQVPLTVDPDGGRLKVARARETGYSALTAVMETPLYEFPDLRALLAKSDTLADIRGVAYNARFLADFGKVRQRGPMELSFTGVTGLTHVRIGERFIGAIVPVRLGDGP
jgi:hypothetical protein